jgi:hypothetical protein
MNLFIQPTNYCNQKPLRCRHCTFYRARARLSDLLAFNTGTGQPRPRIKKNNEPLMNQLTKRGMTQRQQLDTLTVDFTKQNHCHTTNTTFTFRLCTLSGMLEASDLLSPKLKPPISNDPNPRCGDRDASRP